MNYRLNLVLLMMVFSFVTYNVCMSYEDMSEVNVQERFQKIGILETKSNGIVPPRKPSSYANEVASIY